MIKNVLIAVFGITTFISAIFAADNYSILANRKECKEYLRMVKKFRTKQNLAKIPCNEALLQAKGYYNYHMMPGVDSLATRNLDAADEMAVFHIPNEELANMLFDRDTGTYTMAVMGRKLNEARTCVILFPQRPGEFKRDWDYPFLHQTFPLLRRVNQMPAPEYDSLFTCARYYLDKTQAAIE